MREVVTGSQMKQIDTDTIERIGIPAAVLMERAAWAVMETLRRVLQKKDRIWVVCGVGNNGADGIAVARMLHLEGYSPFVILAGNSEAGTKEYEIQLDIAKRLQVQICPYQDFLPGRCDILVDALFGVGLDRPIRGEYLEVVQFLESQTKRFTIAIDIPSGIHADTGAVMGGAISADIAVTFGYEKLGTMLYPGKSYSKCVQVKDIGFASESLRGASPQLYAYELEDLKKIPLRLDDSNKGCFGKILIIAGSDGMSGAAFLSALAAYRTGAGLVKICTVETNRLILQTQLPEAILSTYDPQKIEEDPDAFQVYIEEECAQAEIIVLGPGIGSADYVGKLVELVLTNAYVPVIVDADGLNAIARQPELTSYYTENIMITPHIKEMSRLMGKAIEDIKKDPIGMAREYGSRYGITCVLKDSVTVTAQKEGTVFVNTSGCGAMAKAGSGDVLTGVIAGLLAIGVEEGEAASLGVYLHGLAGDAAAKKCGSHGVLASDIVDGLIAVMKNVDMEAEDEAVSQSLCGN